MECIFCKIISKEMPTEFVYEDDMVVAFRDIHPKAPVHILAVPKSHIPAFNDLTPKDAPLVVALMLAVPAVAHMAGVADGYKIAVNVGTKGGQVVDHLHLHLLGWPDGGDEERGKFKKEVVTV